MSYELDKMIEMLKNGKLHEIMKIIRDKQAEKIKELDKLVLELYDDNRILNDELTESRNRERELRSLNVSLSREAEVNKAADSHLDGVIKELQQMLLHKNAEIEQLKDLGNYNKRNEHLHADLKCAQNVVAHSEDIIRKQTDEIKRLTAYKEIYTKENQFMEGYIRGMKDYIKYSDDDE